MSSSTIINFELLSKKGIFNNNLDSNILKVKINPTNDVTKLRRIINDFKDKINSVGNDILNNINNEELKKKFNFNKFWTNIPSNNDFKDQSFFNKYNILIKKEDQISLNEITVKIDKLQYYNTVSIFYNDFKNIIKNSVNWLYSNPLYFCHITFSFCVQMYKELSNIFINRFNNRFRNNKTSSPINKRKTLSNNFISKKKIKFSNNKSNDSPTSITSITSINSKKSFLSKKIFDYDKQHEILSTELIKVNRDYLLKKDNINNIKINLRQRKISNKKMTKILSENNQNDDIIINNVLHDMITNIEISSSRLSRKNIKSKLSSLTRTTSKTVKNNIIAIDKYQKDIEDLKLLNQSEQKKISDIVNLFQTENEKKKNILIELKKTEEKYSISKKESEDIFKINNNINNEHKILLVKKKKDKEKYNSLLNKLKHDRENNDILLSMTDKLQNQIVIEDNLIPDSIEKFINVIKHNIATENDRYNKYIDTIKSNSDQLIKKVKIVNKKNKQVYTLPELCKICLTSAEDSQFSGWSIGIPCGHVSVCIKCSQSNKFNNICYLQTCKYHTKNKLYQTFPMNLGLPVTFIQQERIIDIQQFDESDLL
jgi:hypothetical protein